MRELIERVLEESGFRENPYFTALRDGSLSKSDFVETQIQFHRAVVFFSRPMAVLAAKIPSPELRLEILRNVWEEHGEGDLSRSHARTFEEFLWRLGGIGSEDIARRVPWPEVQGFNQTLDGACALEDHLPGAAMLGIIERMFCEISSWIGRSVIERGWLTPESLIHYNAHEKLDVKHADDFFDVLRPAWERGPESRAVIERGLRAGAALFDGLYRELYRHRSHRWLREAGGPQPRV